MICLHGKTVCGGAASGEAYVLRRKTEGGSEQSRPPDAREERQRLEYAVSAAKEALIADAERAESAAGREILELHRMMLEDEDLLSSLRDAVRDGASAERAVSDTERRFSELFLETGDETLIARTDDLRDICGRLRAALASGSFPEQPQKPAVLIADELLPGDLLRIGRKNLLGVVLRKGTVYSHTAILLREMGIPSLICKEADAVESGMPVLLDADGGAVYPEPDRETVRAFQAARQRAAGEKAASPLRDFPGALYVNLGDPGEAAEALSEPCGGIGLFRTEYLYLGRRELPGEEEQLAIYRELLRRADGRCVIVRTFDVGSDKSAEAFHFSREENPALGLRGLRVYAYHPEAFQVQLRALLRAAVSGDLRILYPMVTSCREIAELRQALLRAADGLERQGIPYRIPPQGAMIETPAAALLSDELAKTVDFFSVGTNDLTQYTLAADRQDGRLDAFRDPDCRAVLRLIGLAAKNAHQNGIGIGICGELAAEPALIPKWTELGIDYLSVSPSALRAFREKPGY